MWKHCHNRHNCHHAANPAQQVPLCFCKAGQQVTVQAVTGGTELRNRLEALGLVPGTPLTVVRGLANGPFVIEVKGSQLALGHGMSQRIMVA